MRNRFVKRMVAVGAVVSVVGLIATAGSASAAVPNAPIGATPRFYSLSGIQQFRSAGSETTFYMMAELGNLYTQSSIYGCVLSSTDERTCTQANNSATDENDDWSRNEYINGAGVGSGGGIGQLCGTKPTGGLEVDFARSSRAIASSDYGDNCTTSNLLPLNYADDAVDPVDFQLVGQSQISTTVPACTAADISAGDLVTATCQLGPVAEGWRPNDALSPPYSGVAFNNMTVFGPPNTLANRIYCASTNANPITDWGQLTQSGQPVGSGAPIGVPIYIPFVNTASGTYSTYKGLVGCDTNAANKDGQLTQENDAPQMADDGHGAAVNLTDRWPDYSTSGTDPLFTSGGVSDHVFTSNQVAASLYYESYGVALSHPYTAEVAIPTGCSKTACVLPPSADNLMTVDGVAMSEGCDYNDPGICTTLAGNAPPDGTNDATTARDLYNMVITTSIRGSVAGFMNYICDANNPSEYGIDLTNGLNYGNEIIDQVDNDFGFPYQSCLTNSSGTTLPPFVASSPAAGQTVVPASLIGT